jgi:hypothetical protein
MKRNNRVTFLLIPLMIIFFCLIGFFYLNKIFYLIFFAVNIYHVTRQSFGVSKLYSVYKKDIVFQERLIYFFNGLFFLIGYLRFFLGIDIVEYLVLINSIIVAMFIFSIIAYIYLYRFNDNLFSFITGCIIFYPVCFVNNPVHVILLGVTMHFSQYLYLTNKVVSGRNSEKNTNNQTYKNLSYFIFIVIVYGIIMATFSLFGKFEETSLKNLIIIPIIGQTLHFYLDSQLWKFSIKHNREIVLKFLNN